MDISAFIRYPILEDCPEQKFLIGDWLKVGSLVLMTAEPNVGKTAFAMALADAVANGTNFLSSEVINKTKSLFVQFDMDDNTFINYNKLFAPNTPLQVLSEDYYPRTVEGEFERHYIDFNKTDNVNQIIKYCQANEIGLLVVDTLSAVFRELRENESGDMTNALMKLKQISFAGITVIIVHHTSKVINSSMHIARGSGAIVACVDTHICLYYAKEKVGESKVVTYRLSKSRSTQRRVLGMFYVDGSGFHEYVRAGSKDVIADSDSNFNVISQSELDKWRKVLLAAMEKESTKVIDREFVKTYIKAHYNKATAVLNSLIRDGVLKEGKRNKAYVWELIEEGDSNAY